MISRYAGKIHDVGNDAEDQRAEQRVEHAAAPAHEAGPADDHGRDDVKFRADTDLRRAYARASRGDYAGDRRERAADDVDGQHITLDRHAGEPNRLLVGADGGDDAAEARIGQHHAPTA